MKKLLILTLALFYFSVAFADTFIVTSNADSGPGTLREAITMANANGNNVVDNINFNITDVSITGRTITLLTSFPDLTSNIIIDASTQPGVKIGVSDSKIRITNPIGVGVDFVFRVIGNGNIEFYGFHFDKINSTFNVSSATAIQLHSVYNIKVGAAGKGNYFTRLAAAIQNTFLPAPGKGMVNGLSFKANIVNLAEDGTAIMPQSFAMAINLMNVKNLEIGGDQPGEGNYMSSIIEYMVVVAMDTLAHMNFGYAKILNNKLGCNYTETAGLSCGCIYLQNSEYYGYTDTTNITVKGNTYNALSYAFSSNMQTFIKISGKKGFIDIKANRIGVTGNSNAVYFSIISTAISIGSCENGIIGGDNAADTNIIAGANYAAIGLGNNKNIRVTKNSLFCNSQGIAAFSTHVTIPKTKIFTITDYFVQGTTTANSTVEVFLTKVCSGCKNGKTYLGNCTADATGNWSFTSPLLLDGAVTATGTSVQGATGEFATPEYEMINFTTKSPTCGQNNGFIHGMHFVSGTKYYWLKLNNNQTDTIFSENVDNAGPGSYKFVVEQGAYCSATYSVYLYDNSPKIYSQYSAIVHPSCGLNNGRIYNHSATGSYNKIIWKDGAGNVAGNTLDLLNAGPGQYKLIILDTTYGCGDSTIFYSLVNQAGPSLNTSNVQVTSASCSNNNGSVTGITALNVTGIAFIQWVDSLNRPVSNTIDLLNIGAGKYRLKFKDGSSCDTLITTFYVVAGTGLINIDVNQKLITASKCILNTGSITQIKVTGGETFTWTNTSTNTVVANTIDVYNLAPGNYILSVSNHFGCALSSPAISVSNTVFVPVAVTAHNLQHAFCALDNGAIRAENFSNTATLYNFRWMDSVSAQSIGNGIAISNLKAGTYLLFATDSNGCEKKIFSATVKNLPLPVFDYTNLQLRDDRCDLGTGSISNIAVTNLTGPSIYTWYNQNNVAVGSGINLQNIAAGTYTLKVTDAGVCNLQSAPFTVVNNNTVLPAPLYDNLVVPRYASASLLIKGAVTGNYLLLPTANASTALQQNSSGNFTVAAINSDTVFYVKQVNGTCYSPTVAVTIKVVDKSYFAIPNAFTPNGDGKNDQLNVRINGYINLVYFKVYNKWGEQVFETRDFATGWDGRYKGALQNTGSYIWIAEGKDFNGNLINDRGMFTLIR
ncbi:T9SS type B sorting domain-containing protein [Ferruginibacter sp.]|nr:T9SS type B sorting domain-containing protein [Ferruginibacter sp.]